MEEIQNLRIYCQKSKFLGYNNIIQWFFFTEFYWNAEAQQFSDKFDHVSTLRGPSNFENILYMYTYISNVIVTSFQFIGNIKHAIFADDLSPSLTPIPCNKTLLLLPGGWCSSRYGLVDRWLLLAGGGMSVRFIRLPPPCNLDTWSCNMILFFQESSIFSLSLGTVQIFAEKTTTFFVLIAAEDDSFHNDWLAE